MAYEAPLGPLGEAFLTVEVFSADGRRSLLLRAKLDTGAYTSMLPLRTIEGLGLVAVEGVTLDTTAGPMPSHTYVGRIKVDPIFDGETLLVSGRPGKEQMLLGRTWLKSFVLTYDGLGRRFSVATRAELGVK